MGAYKAHNILMVRTLFMRELSALVEVIPEAVMFREGYISREDDTIGKKGFSIPLKDMEYGIRKWMQPFEYNYSTPDKDKLLALFGCV